MLRHFIHPFFTKYSCMKPSRFDRRIFKILLLDSVSKIGNYFVSKGTVSLITCVTKKGQAKQIAVGIGMLSGCCFSKGSDEYEPIQETSEPIEQTEPITEKLSATAQSLLSEVKDNTIFVCSNEGLDNRTFSGCTDNNDKGMEAQPNVVPDKTEACLVTLAEGAVADNDVVYKGTEKCKRQKLSKKMKKALQGDGASQVEDKSRRRKPARISPNYFVAFQVTNSEIRNAMKVIQNHITAQDSRFALCMEPISKSHVTLMVMHLDDKEHSRALNVLKDIHKEFNETMHTSPLKLQFTGIGNFGNKVFAKLQDEDLQRLRDCAERIQYHFNNAEITSTDDSGRQFDPHLTIMKLSRDPSLFRKGVRKISPALYKPYENHPFGVEVIKSIQLLSMQDALDENGYYRGTDLPFGASQVEDKSRRRKPARISPNYFVAFQVTNSEIRNAMKEIQNHITAQDSRFASSMEPISKSHVTLMVMHLDDKEHSRALNVLKDVHKEFNETMHTSPLKLQFTGIGNFGNKVVFAKLQEDEGLQRLRDCAERIQYHFNNAEITSTDDSGRQFNPHLTIMKLSRDPSLFRKGVRKISPALYKTYENHPFGVEVIKSIQLLSMQDALDENGYYRGTDLPFDVRDSEEVDKNANF